MKLQMIFCTQRYGNWQKNMESWGDVPMLIVEGVRPLTKAYQEGFERSEGEILGYCHDDVTCLDPDWQRRVLDEFARPNVGLVGFGGSSGHGNKDIYRKPYQWEDVGREGVFMSNLVNAEIHGARIMDSREASVLDGFAMFVKRDVLEQVGGWPQGTPIAYWAYDYWLSCETRRQGKRVRVVGVYCEHTCPPEYRSYVVEENCQAAHQWLYDNYRDTFPARVMP